jgi:hypothetical protein
LQNWKGAMIRAKLGRNIALSLVAFAVAAVALPRPYLFDFVNGMAIAFSIGVVVRYWTGIVDFVRSLYRGLPLKPGHLLISASVLILAAFGGRTIWIEVWRQTYGGPHGSLDHVMFALLAWLLVPASLMALAGPTLWRANNLRKEGPTLPITAVAGLILSAAFAVWRYFDPL